MRYLLIARVRPMPAPFRQFLKRYLPDSSPGDRESLSPYMKSSMAALHTRVAWERAVVLSVARGVEPDPAEALRWFANDPIREFGDKTAQQLVEEGNTTRLLTMLVAIRSGRRDS